MDGNWRLWYWESKTCEKTIFLASIRDVRVELRARTHTRLNFLNAQKGLKHTHNMSKVNFEHFEISTRAKMRVMTRARTDMTSSDKEWHEDDMFQVSLLFEFWS